MFATLFKKSSQFYQKGKADQLAWAISANEKTVVVWSKINDVTIITSYDYAENTWIQRTQEFAAPITQNAFKIHLSENGNTLIHYGNDRINISTWQRLHRNSNWIQKNTTQFKPNNNPNTDNIYIAFHKNNIFAAHKDNFTIINRTIQKFKLVRKQKTLHNDHLQCFSFGYDHNHLTQVVDGVVYYWDQNNEAQWDKKKPARYNGGVMPFYSSYQNNEVKAFIPGSVWMINYPERTSYEYKNENIKEKQTQSALNYFFQNEKQKSIEFWYRKDQGIKEFKSESLNIEAIDILLGMSGKVFVTQKKTNDHFQIEFYIREGQ